MRALNMVFAALLLSGCQVMQTPSGYVTVEPRGERIFHAVSPAGCTLEVREQDSPEDATLEFWAEAIRRELVENRGYVQREDPQTFAAGDLAGMRLLFTAPPELGEYLYLVALVLDGESLLVLEAGGQAAQLEADLPAIDTALRTLRFVADWIRELG